jgi:hypothetical protein
MGLFDCLLNNLAEGPIVFYVYEGWEDVERIAVLRTLFGQPGLHQYPFVELAFNSYLFHVDVAPVDEQSRWQRFVFDRLENIFKFSQIEGISKYKIYIQTRRGSFADYELKRVVEIASGNAVDGESVFIFSCADGSVEISSLNSLAEHEVVLRSKIWRQPHIDEK